MPPPLPPELLDDDVIGEVLLRLPPGDPACLVRASIVCKTWRRLVSDGAFLQRYRTFHWTPPVLGFFEDQFRKGTGSVIYYVPTIQASPVIQQAVAVAVAEDHCRIVDCRHGRVLFQAGHEPPLTFIVWDPITGKQKCISLPVHPYCDNSELFMAAVLCAVDGCDHLGCSVGPFVVVVTGINYGDWFDGDGVAWTILYSSKTGVWSAPTSIVLESNCFVEAGLPSLVVGDAIYFMLEYAVGILKYSLVGDVLSVMTAPPHPIQDEHEPNMIFAAVQDGELGAASMEGYSLQLWLWQTDRDGVGEWARCRVIELDVMIPISIGDPSTVFYLAGYAQGAGSVFVEANDDIFIVELKSGQVTKISKRTSYGPIFPFTSFYTPVKVLFVHIFMTEYLFRLLQ